ncbi:MAG: metallopeptidase family protein [Actinobacteria bacterium]|nr:metallopeptidase family protein [Actinomycetota bacterium]
MEKNKFEEIILDTLKNLPDKFKDKIKNLSIVIEENDISEVLENNKDVRTKYTLGLYQGLPATKRAGRINILPDKITIYKKSLEEISRSDKELEKNIKKVILHELGHYFGLDEKKLRRLGY